MYIPTIPLVWDNVINKHVPTDYLHEFFTEHELSHIRSKNIEEKRFVCFKCRNPVKMKATKNSNVYGGHRYFFSHPLDIECEWKGESKSKAEIYNGVQEGKRHLEMKKLLLRTLTSLSGWTNIGSDDTFFFNSAKTERRKPDVYATNERQEDIVFEIQLRSEDPAVISARQNFYYERNNKLVWFSAENTELVDDEFKFSCIETKLVQKDIAYSNCGNWYIFNEDLAELSISNKTLTFLVKYHWPEQLNGIITFKWKESIVTLEDVEFINGKMIYVDCIAEYEKLRTNLFSKAKSIIPAYVDKSKFRDWQSFLDVVKEVWPNISMLKDSQWLNDLYETAMNKKMLVLKRKVISIFKERVDQTSQHKWDKLALATEGMNLGINQGENLTVVEKTLIILGYKLRPHLNIYQSCHNFHDHETFHQYFDVYMKARELSPLSEELNQNQTLIKRKFKIPQNVVQDTDLISFLKWFSSVPVLPRN